MEVWLRPGHIVRLHDGEYVVDMVNESRARCYPFKIVVRTYRTRFGETFRMPIRKFRDPVSITPAVEPPIIVGHRPPRWLKRYLRRILK